MARMTIAQMREKELDRLVAYKTSTPTEADYTEARRLMNSFYRLCGLSYRVCMLQNSETTCNGRYCAEQEAKEEKWFNRLKGEFNRLYGLDLYYSGICPSIGTKNENGGVSEKISRYFYN